MGTSMAGLVADPDRVAADLRTLEGLVEPGRPGWTRTALGPADRDGRQQVRTWMTEAGLDATIDGAGNVVGRLRGAGPGARTLMVGSHTDTVVGGGRFDGMVGVAGALELVRVLREEDQVLQHDLVVVDFFGEEPNEFGLSCVGSRAMTGELTPEHLALLDDHGRTLGGALSQVGIDPDEMLRARVDLAEVDAFVELHIEQGPYLERHGSQIGLVESITGIARFRALFTGQADHAGTTPMDTRRDAGCAAAGTVLAVERIAGEGLQSRGTSGQVTFTPAALNVVTAAAEFRGEFRGPEGEWLRHARQQLDAAAAQEGTRRGVDVDVEWLPLQDPAPMSGPVTATLAGVVEGLGLSSTRLFSGAEHDAAVIGRRVPAGMLFVPSRDGRSHCPEEWTDLSDVAAGVTALIHGILALDRGAR
jgi:beta-ureidopropionase / N-carbamoyl-L-amino-acid hydrolase